MGDIDLLDPDPDALSKILKREQLKLSTPHLANAGVEMAFELTYWGHRGAPTRASGEAYVFHPLRAAIVWIWYQLELGIRDHQVTQGILIHDTGEDAKKAGLNPKLVYTNIASYLGGDVAGDVYYNTKQKHLGETGEGFFRRLLRSGLWRPIVIRLIERTDNIQTLKSMPADKQVRKIKETKRWRKRLVHQLRHLLAIEVKAGHLDSKWLHLPTLLDHNLRTAVQIEEKRIRTEEIRRKNTSRR